MAKISRYVFFLASFFLFTFLAPHANAAGVLRVHPSNPRYLTDNSGNAIYLTGSHTWNQWQDYFDFNAYLDFLDSYNHNYIRLWSGDYGVGSSPSPYLRTGPGTAVDGGPKVDLDQLNQAYFNRIRSNVIDAGNRGKYVGINLLTAMNKAADWDYSFFKSSNNIQGINGDTNGDGIGFESTDLSIPQITAYQEAVVRKMVDTLNDLDNVLYEIVNEGDNSSIAWQYHFINYLKNYQAGKPKQHPVGMSATLDWQGGSFANNNSALFNSPADWIAPGGSSYIDNMPAASGAKVILLDSDHIASVGPDWVWKSFMRGLQPNLMDWYNTGSPPQHWYTAAQQDVMRKYMGYTLNYSKKINLAAMTPRGDLTSSGYALASPGSEYLIYSPAGGSLSATLTSGNYTYEWFNSATGSVAGSGNVTGSGSNQAMPSQPFSGEGVLYLKSGGTTPTPTPNITPTPTTSCPNSWNSSLAVPANFGAAFNWFTSEKELLVNVLCSGNSNTVNVGNGSSVQYIHKTGHVWQNNQWTAFNYSGQNMDAEGNWFIGSANHSLGTLDLTQKQSVLAYICEWTGVWKCGCSDNSCSINHWNLQQFKQ